MAPFLSSPRDGAPVTAGAPLTSTYFFSSFFVAGTLAAAAGLGVQ